jgi:hypothetical protein
VHWEKPIFTLKIMHFAVDCDLFFKRNLSRVEELLRNVDVIPNVWIGRPRNGVLQRKREGAVGRVQQDKKNIILLLYKQFYY